MKCVVICLLLGAALGGTSAEPVYENTFCKQQRCPYDGDFRCKTTGRCLRPWYACDGYSSCTDGSDEQTCGTPNFGCYGYLCDNRTTCASYHSICDGYISCIDKSDEGYCLYRSCPYDGDFKCSDGKCLRSYQVCDGNLQCLSGEDEQNCDSKLCPYNGEFRCGTGECIRSTIICNRYNNCRDGSDEFNCIYDDECPYNGDIKCNSRCYRSNQFCDHYQRCFSNTTTNCSSMSCPYDEDFRCPLSGICIRSYELCDGYSDCPDREDEQNCTLKNCRNNRLWCNRYDRCLSPYSSCGRLNICGYNCSYSCINSTQVSNSYYIFHCDGINDCADGSDETDCYSETCLEANDFRCQSTGACIRQVKVCDGIVHCSDGSDETNCTSLSCPVPGDVKCRDTGMCIHYDKVCDGQNDCMDGSDEENCALRSCPYSDDRRCNSSQACIRATEWCNNYLDCVDGSDEEYCYDIPCPYAGDFHCGYGYCVRGYDVCDGYEECLDGSDEGMNYCAEDFTMGIHWERTLTNTTNTHKCSDIHPSFKLSNVITRQCLRNRTWAPVNMSQCVMTSDSPVLMIVIVTLDTNSTSLVKSKQDIIIQEMEEMIVEQPVIHVEIIQSVSSADVSVKITFEFNTFTTTEVIGSVKYDKNLTTLGNLSVNISPLLTIFESTDTCQCPDGVSLSTTPTGANDTESIDVVSVCSGKPCEYSSDSNFTYQCGAPYVGDGKMCGKDSDGDGYPDMQLNCSDSHCIQDNCPTVYNPDQKLETCNGTQGITNNDDDDDDDGLSTPTVVGSTFAITLVISILFTLLIVYIVYKIKESTANNKPSSVGAIVTAMASLPTDSTIKSIATIPNDDYEYPEDSKSANYMTRYQKNPSAATMQSNPAYSLETIDKNDSTPVYENLK